MQADNAIAQSHQTRFTCTLVLSLRGQVINSLAIYWINVMLPFTLIVATTTPCFDVQ